MKIIYLVRHSKPIKNNITLQIKNEQIPLSKEGEKLASEMSVKHFSNIDYLWSSEYERAISTAKYISELNNISINITPLFNERKLGNTDNVKEEFWLTQLKEENAKTINGESRKEVTERMLKGINNILNTTKDNTQTVIITHATAMTFLLMNWCKLKEASLKGKKRHLTFKEKTVINDSFNTPEIFKLEFDNNELLNINRVI